MLHNFSHFISFNCDGNLHFTQSFWRKSFIIQSNLCNDITISNSLSSPGLFLLYYLGLLWYHGITLSRVFISVAQVDIHTSQSSINNQDEYLLFYIISNQWSGKRPPESELVKSLIVAGVKCNKCDAATSLFTSNIMLHNRLRKGVCNLLIFNSEFIKFALSLTVEKKNRQFYKKALFINFYDRILLKHYIDL